MARCLVTGHEGYIGSKLIVALEAAGHQVTGVDFKTDPRRDVSYLLREDRDGDFHPFYKEFKPEYIFHLACLPRVGYSVENPVATMYNNVLQTSHLLNYAHKMGTKRVIYSGSSSVMGNGNGPQSPYGLQKLISEMECKLYSDLYGIDTVTLRYFNVYSPCQKADGPYATAIANWMHTIRNDTAPFITGTGEQRRDMAHLDDIISANIFAMEHKDEFKGQYFDVGTGENISLNEASILVKKYFPKVVFDYVSERRGDIPWAQANPEPLRKLGWVARRSITEGISECFSMLKEERQEGRS
jgi:UDP-glucose 4-epimerase